MRFASARIASRTDGTRTTCTIYREQARTLIVDIAGVALVDTLVADNLLKTTAAVRLLGAETILSGVTPQVAQTFVHLGIDVSAMRTVSRLSDAIELALASAGARIAPR